MKSRLKTVEDLVSLYTDDELIEIILDWFGKYPGFSGDHNRASLTMMFDHELSIGVLSGTDLKPILSYLIDLMEKHNLHEVIELCK